MVVSNKIRVVIVDDHRLVRLGIKRLLEDQSGIVVLATVKNGEEAVEIARTLKPDVMLMDVQMPGIGGLEATRRCLRAHPDLKVIAITIHEEEPYPTQLLKVGAVGYLTKKSDDVEMIMAIHRAVSGERYIAADIAQQLALRPFQEEVSSPFDWLSTREMQITLMIIMGLKVNNISDKLSLSTKTVNTYRYRIFGKLGVKNDVALTKLAIKHGIIDAGAVA